MQFGDTADCKSALLGSVAQPAAWVLSHDLGWRFGLDNLPAAWLIWIIVISDRTTEKQMQFNFRALCVGLTASALAGCLLTRHPSATGTEFCVPTPTAENPVAAEMRVFPIPNGNGKQFEAVIRVRIAATHHLHGPEEKAGPFAPLSVNLVLPAGSETHGGWQFSKPARVSDDRQVYTNSVVLRQSLSMPLNAPVESLSIKAELRFQACSEDFCWPPQSIRLAAPLTKAPPSQAQP